MKICFFGCLKWFNCNVNFAKPSSLITDKGQVITTNLNQSITV